MINLSPKKFPELKGCRSFGFNARLKTHLYSHCATKNFIDTIRQSAAAGYVRGIIEAIRTLPCEVNIRVGARKGVAFYNGEINAPGQTSLDNAALLIAATIEQLKLFTQSYPQSSFSVKADQAIEFCNIQR